MQGGALHLNEHGVASGPLGNSCLLGELAWLRTCSAFSSTTGVSRLKWRGALNKQNSSCLIGNVSVWSCQMKLGCRTMWKTNKLYGFSPVVTVRETGWIPPGAGSAGE